MIDLDAIKARLTAAIPGPWYVDESLRGVEAQAYGYPVEVVAWTGRAEAVLIAHAPADIGALIAEVERLRSINDEYLLEMGRQHAKLREQALEAKRERAAVVAWLRVAWGAVNLVSTDIVSAEIERGDHRREGDE